MRKRFRPIALIVAFLFCGHLVNADDVTAKIKIATEKTGKVLECSPSGKRHVKGTLTILEAVKKLRTGMILRILPGTYSPKYEKTPEDSIPGLLQRSRAVLITQSGIVIEGNGSGKMCELRLFIQGTGVIVRNLRVRALEICGATVINSRMNECIVTNSGARSSTLIYNSIITSFVEVYPDKSSVLFKNCTILRIYDAKHSASWSYHTHRTWQGMVRRLGKLGKQGGKLTFENCILYCSDHLFWRATPGLQLLLKNCLIHSDMGYLSSNLKILTMDEFKESSRMKVASVGNIFEKPEMRFSAEAAAEEANKKIDAQNLAFDAAMKKWRDKIKDPKKKPKRKPLPRPRQRPPLGFLLKSGAPGTKKGCGILGIDKKTGLPTPKK